jgi:predicted transcriptional regulator
MAAKRHKKREKPLQDTTTAIEFLAAIREGEEQADRGDVIPHEQVKKEFASWIQIK